MYKNTESTHHSSDTSPHVGQLHIEAVHRSLVARWALLPASSSIKRWVGQLGRAGSAYPDREDSTGCAVNLESVLSAWQLVGQGVVLEHDDGLEACGLLAMVAQAAQMSYVEIPAHQVVSTFHEWRSLLGAESPTLLHLQSGDWICDQAELDDDALFPHEPGHDSGAAAKFRRALAQAMAADLRGNPVVVVVAVSKIDKLADDLRLVSQFSRRIAVPEAESAVHGKAFLAMCQDLPWDANIRERPAAIGAVVRPLSMDQRLKLLGALRHTAWRDDRTLTQRDLIECRLFGMSQAERDAEPPLMRWRTAVHEAGHVLIEYLASGGTSVATYCSIEGHGDSMGVAVPMYDRPKQLDQGERTYGDLLQELKVWLAGRAAEQVLLGPLEVSASGSEFDLERAGRLAIRMLSRRGLPLDVASDSAMSANLLVVFGTADEREREFHGNQARQLLQDQYQLVLDLMRQHEPLLTLLATRLSRERVLLQDELIALLGGADQLCLRFS